MGRYKESMEYAKKADASARYNRAFERYRSQWLREHLTQLLLGVVLIIAGVMLLKYFARKQKNKKQPSEPAQTGSGT